MDITPALPVGRSVIHRYHPTFRISGVDFSGAVLVAPDSVIPWDIGAIDVLSLDSLRPLFDKPHDLVLIGTGSTFRFPDPDLRKALKSSGYHAEFMATDAACRTFNVLMAEGRDVLAALRPFEDVID